MNVEQVSVGAALIAFAGGLVSFFSPCVAPLVPGYLGYLSRSAVRLAGTDTPALQSTASATARACSTERVPAAPSSPAGSVASALASPPAVHAHPVEALPADSVARRSTARTTLLFVGGFSVAFVALGLLAASFGSLFVAYQPVMQTVVGIVMLAMGAFVLGWVPRQLSAPLLREWRLHLDGRTERLGGAAAPFVLGVVFAAGWTPCIGPVLAALLTYVGAAANLGWGATLLALYALGFALPFLALGMGWSLGLRTVQWVNRHERTISLATGALLLVVGLLYVSGQITLFAIWAQRYTPTLFR